MGSKEQKQKQKGAKRPPPVRPPQSPPRGIEPGNGVNPDVKKMFYAGAALAFLVSLIFYVKTMAASASFWDAGEFIATSYTLGIPHSPGTPLYVLVGRVFTLLPLPLSTAAKVNLLSVVCGALGVLFVYLLIVRFLDFMLGKTRNVLDAAVKVAGGLAGAYFIAFSDTYWVNATESEVYAMSCFLMGFMTWLGLKWEENPKGIKATSLIYLLFYLLALSVGFHLGTILAFSGIFFIVLLTKEKTFTNFEFVIACLGVGIFVADATLYREGGLTIAALVVFAGLLVWMYTQKSMFSLICTLLFVLGVSVHLFLLIRSGHNPSIDEADPETWRNLYAVLRREQYPPPNMLARKASFLFQFEHFNGYFQKQFQMVEYYLGRLNLGSIIPIGLGLWGMIDHFTKHRKSFIVLFITFVVTSIGLILYLNFSDHEVRDRDYFYSPAFYYFAVFIGIGVSSLISEIRRFFASRDLSDSLVTYTMAGLLLVLPFFTAKHHYFTHDRSNNFVCHDYAENMLGVLEKDAIIFTNGDNDTFPLWYIQEVENFRKDIRVVNLSLLNTSWYVKQLKENEPKLPISWSEDRIKNLGPVQTKDGWILVRDLAINHILRENYRLPEEKRRPIYFAVTIPPEHFAPYRDHLEMEGLVYLFKYDKDKVKPVNKEKLEDNIVNKFSYRSILTGTWVGPGSENRSWKEWKRDETVYLSPHTLHLIQNYAAAFCQLGFMKHRNEKYDQAITAFEIAKEISPHIDPVVYWLGWYYLDAGDTAKAIAHYREHIRKYPERLELYYRLAGVYERVGDYNNALVMLEELLSKNPEDRDAVLGAVGIAIKLNLPFRARSYIDGWLKNHPNDEEMKKALDELEQATVPIGEDFQQQQDQGHPESTEQDEE